MNRAHNLIALAVLLAACGGARSESAPAATASVADGSELRGIVLRYAPGGAKPEAFCVPEWSIANQTESAIGAIALRIAWLDASGQVLEAAGERGTFLENLKAGERRDRTLNGHPMNCADLRIVVTDYACRDANAARQPCPGPVKVLTSGGIQADVSGLKEGPLPGFRN